MDNTGQTFGHACRLYRNAGASWDAPTHVEVSAVRDLTLNLSAVEADDTGRDTNGWEATAPALLQASVDFTLRWKPEDEGFEALRDAFLAREPIELLILDGDILTSGAQGLRAWFSVVKFARNEGLKDRVTADVSVKPAAAANPPEWHTVA